MRYCNSFHSGSTWSIVHPMSAHEDDLAIRVSAFQFLEEQERLFGGALPYDVLVRGFEYKGLRIPLVSPQGIFKPKASSLPLSITTAAPSDRRARAYDDGVDGSGMIRYRYRGTNPLHPDNVGLREAMRLRIPLIYFHGLAKGLYQSIWPVVIVGDDPGTLSFSVSPEDHVHVLGRLKQDGLDDADAMAEIRRAYVARQVRQRLHQAAFRVRVLEAYHERCCICDLRHPELLDAAHIIGDSEVTGEPKVPNGLSLCKLHHAAFDLNIIGIRPDYIVDVRQDILDEVDGPMLRHGIQGVQGQRILLPTRRVLYPDEQRLEERYEGFRKAV